jgi:hypothetical protein
MMTSGHAQLSKQPFEKLFNDPEIQKAYRTVREAGYLTALKRTATMTPTTAVVGNSNVADDSAEAVRQLKEMAEQSGRSFEVVFAAPENRELAARTYTMHNRPNTSSTSGSELQR